MKFIFYTSVCVFNNVNVKDMLEFLQQKVFFHAFLKNYSKEKLLTRILRSKSMSSQDFRIYVLRVSVANF